MLTKNEVTALNLSPTKKDFVQIWNELLDVSKKLSERWDPTSTNESDPGIVLLKALTGIADKLNYNIDKNTLEAFMPTAAQEESMRKLCDMLGYNIKYFQSATTKVNISYYNAEPSEAESEALAASLEIPKFTVITNVDKTVSYFTINKDSLFMNSGATNLTVDCMEGQVVKCSSINENSLITENLITTDNRFYLPETQIAENGIFVYSAMTIEKDGKMLSVDGKPWTKVDNLNTAANGSTVYKFGFDSFEGRPFIEFKDDYSELFGAGLYIYYTRTSGANGNVSPRTLTVLESPGTTGWDSVSMESFTVENPSATTTGVNPETISQAYKNFKKTIGTFDTLVTCRDYMNKIYSFMTDENKPYVSNVLVTDIRNDLNRAITICTADDSGIFYHEVPLYKPTSTSVPVDTDKIGLAPVFNSGHWYLGNTGLKLDASVLEDTKGADADAFIFDRTGTPEKNDDGYWWIKQDISEVGGTPNIKSFKTTLATSQPVTINSNEPAIDHFDLVIYPFKSYNQVKSNVKDIRAVYDSSFTYTASTFSDIQTRLETDAISTIAHAYKQPQPGDIVSINNYLKLNALISTNTKLTAEEGTLIIEKIKFDLANAFNMRELDFGEEIPVDAILKVIESADSRIRIVSLAEPALYTTFSVLKNYDEKNNAVIAEYAVASEAWLTEDAAVATKRFREQNSRYAYDTALDYFDTSDARKIYNYLVLRNVLAGRVPLFNYDNTFRYAASEAPYLTTSTVETGIPTELTNVTLTAENPIAMFSKDGDVYTKLFTGEGTDPVVHKTTNPHTQYDGGPQPIQKLETFCNINAPGGVAKDVELADGEYIKFRAPNFITKATYPAYVNYHLHLNNTLHTPADPAVSTSLFNRLNVDHDIYDAADPIELMWHKVLAFFGAIDLARFGELAYNETPQEERLLKRFTLQQRVSAATTTDGGIPAIPATSTVYLAEGVTQAADGGQDTITPEQWLAESGCVRLLNTCQDYTTTSGTTAKAFAAEVTFDDGDDVNGFSFYIPVYSKKDEVDQGTLNNFIIDPDVFGLIKQYTDDELKRINDAGKLPDKPWTLAYNFDCVPFTTASLEYWEAFIQGKPVKIKYAKDDIDNEKVTTIYPGVRNDECTQGTTTWGNESRAKVVADHFNAQTDERERLFWRIFEGGYEPGKCVDSMRNKYLPIDPSYIRSLPDQKTQNAYILTTLGVDAKPEQINNDEEYQLMQGEKLYFEYTPSTQTVDGASETLPPVTKVFGEGTIIRPSGFEPGLIDSEALKTSGKSYVKNDVVFKTDTNSGSEIVKLHSLGASEQIEIRDFAKVDLPNDKLQVVYMYKNFDCDILENWDYSGERSYTLKDGEYIFYTDNNKVELAFFTTGTKVTLTGSVVIPRFDKIEIATILDTGITEIPWRYIPLTSKEDKITFLEYQYVTLGKKDKLGTVVLSGNYSTNGTAPQITSEWTPCEKDATYYLAADPTKEVVLPSVRLADGIGGGWEVCSVLELEASPTNTQTLRRTDKIQTGLNMFTYANETTPVATLTPTLMATDSEKGYPMSFRTNLICQANSTKITMQDIYSNPKDYAGFSVKCFAVNRPTIVKTQRGKVLPKFESLPTNFDFASWQGDFIDDKAATELWTSINMDNLHSWVDGADHDNALKLSINVLPNTYGIMSIYVRHTSTDSAEQAQVWLEQIPGAERYSTLGNAVLDGHTITNLSYDNFITVLPTGYGSTDTTDSTRYLLRPGLNCLAINASTTFFIKASENAQGTVSFDDVQLVSTKSSSFGAAQNRTLGLNLAQIGFLPVFDGLDEMTAVTNEVREAKKTELSTAFNNASKHISRTASRLFTNQLGNANKNLLKVANQIQQIRDLTTDEDLCDKIIDELSTIAALDDQTNLLSIKNALTSSIAIGDNIIKAVDDAKAAKQLTKDIVETQKQLFAVYGDDETEEVLKKLYTELSYVRGLPQKDNSSKDTASVLQTVSSLNCLTAETIQELKATALKLDVEAKQEYLANIIQELKTPPAHQDYSGALSAVASLYELILEGNGDLRQKAATFKNITSNSTLTQLKATLETIKANLESTATVTVDEETNAETIIYGDGVKAKIDSITDLIIAIESGSFDALAGVLGITTGSPTGNIRAILDDILSITDDTGNNAFYTIIQQEDALTDLELERVESLINDLSDTIDKTGNFLETTQAVIDFLDSLTAVEPQNLEELTASNFVVAYTEVELPNNVCKAVAKVCSTTEGFVLPTKDVVYRDFVAAKLTQLIVAIDSKANCAEINTILTMTNREAACVDKYITDSVKTIIDYLRDTCSWTVSAYAGISSLIKNMTNSIGAYSSISNSIPDNVEDDLLQVVIDDLIEALPAKTAVGGAAATDETTVNEARVFFLIQQLRSIVTSEKSVLDFIDSRLTGAVTNATADIAEINSTSAIIALLKRTIKNSTATGEDELRTLLGNSITAAFTHEENLLSLINNFLLLADPMSLNNFLTAGSESFADTTLAIVLNAYHNMLLLWPNEVDYELDPIRAWSGLKANLDLYDGVAGIVKTLMLVNKLFYDQFKDELGNDYAANIDAIFENASLQAVINGIQEIKAKILSGELASDAAQRNMLKELLPAIYELEQDIKDIELDLKTVPKDLEEICKARFTENLLLTELRKLDTAHEFYYNVSVEDSLAIDFNESEEKHNTLMNPAMNYSINNINNSFVISKLDIDHLTKGIQLARSSRLS